MKTTMSIEKGREIYGSLAERTGIPIDDAFLNMPGMLGSPFSDPDEFLAALGVDDVAAVIEARSHFGLPLFE